ncbi:MAG: competence/damage-inducible protein A [Ignavibacteriae bacterium]|jgi:nicotinamide-nucleotide amidase|nr:competence/damage-inducible protein A [Ignavibacteriota bacterium]NOG98254.1 competence/damage-inducible protein A [Ignavibacteriota bacterium]
MKAQIITIGDEILIGQTVNTNSAFIGERLTEIQLDVAKSVTIGDTAAIILHEFAEAFKNSSIVIVTGGLGPTHDDVTRKCIADFFETELVFDEKVLADVHEIFKKKGREVTKTNEDQALVPKIAEVIRNKRGTAPGTWIEKDGKIFISLPGVPYEMKLMMDEFVIPKLKERYKTIEGRILTKNLLTTGIPESYLYEKLGDLDELLNGAKLAFLPNQFGVKMRITVIGESEEDAKDTMVEIEQKIRSLIGRYIYGYGEILIEEVTGRLLKERGLKIAVAESCTGGLISSRFTDISGSSEYFDQGMVTYNNVAKVESLKVNEDSLEKFGAVSIEIARQMAEGVKAVSGSDIGLAVTGIMGPTGATEDKPVGLVYIGICDDKVCTAKEFMFGDDRLLNKDRTAQAAIDMVRRHLLGIPYDE